MTTTSKPAPPVHLSVNLELPGGEVKSFAYNFRQPSITLGREPTNDLQVPLTTVSRQHARIFFEIGDFFLEDLGSTHGTEHNKKRLLPGEKRLLRDGDVIRVMNFEVVFKTTQGSKLDRQPGEKTEALARRMAQEVLASLGGKAVEPPALRIMNGPEEGRRYELNDDRAEITIGRSPDCDLSLNDQNASRRHCLIKRSWHGFTAQDLGSKNGVLVNESRIEGSTLLKDGDELQIGSVKLVFIDPPSRLMAQMGSDDGQTTSLDAPGAPNAAGEADPEGAGAFEGELGAADDAVEGLDPILGSLAEAPKEPEPSDPLAELDPEQLKKLKRLKEGGRLEVFLLLFGLIALVLVGGFFVWMAF